MTAIKKQYRWSSPSNIALVKYWGKREGQLPENASLSFTLSESRTDTTLIATESHDQVSKVKVYVDGTERESFKPKVENLIAQARKRHPALSRYSYEIHTGNTFPHSSGIASSASGMSALALCLVELAREDDQMQSDFLQEAGILSRLGSGSACRSLYGGTTAWGRHHALPLSSDEYAVPVEHIHPIFTDYRDSILLIYKGVKDVSSSAGHALLKDHPFASTRFRLAGLNMDRILHTLRHGDLDGFIEIVESEALMLHALMMTSTPSYLLMQAGTVEAIHQIRRFREQHACPVAFTLDAGANVHILYPSTEQDRIKSFIDNNLVQLCEDRTYLCDKVGQGPYRIPC